MFWDFVLIILYRAVQVVTQLMIAANVFVSLSKNESPDRVSVVSLGIGFVSVVAGELGLLLYLICDLIYLNFIF